MIYNKRNLCSLLLKFYLEVKLDLLRIKILLKTLLLISYASFSGKLWVNIYMLTPAPSCNRRVQFLSSKWIICSLHSGRMRSNKTITCIHLFWPRNISFKETRQLFYFILPLTLKHRKWSEGGRMRCRRLGLVSGQHRGFENQSDFPVSFMDLMPFRHRSSDIAWKCTLVDRRGLKCSPYSLSLAVACSLIHHLENINFKCKEFSPNCINRVLNRSSPGNYSSPSFLLNCCLTSFCFTWLLFIALEEGKFLVNFW